MSPVRVLVVDDSATMRQLIASSLSRDPDIEVVGLASDAASARVSVKELNPDVMTLDVEMPNMDGLQFLEKIMRLRPMPVVMVSTLTMRGSDTAIEALELGAVDCIAKPTPEFPSSFDQLPEAIKRAASVRSRQRVLRQPVMTSPLETTSVDFRPADRVVAIGSSTGGVEALIAILSRFPANCAPTVIAQHMPALFTLSLANRLDRLSQPRVLEAWHGAPLRSGHVYIAPGGDKHLEVSGRDRLVCSLRAGEPVNGHRPSVDVLFGSVARVVGANAVGVILTGMGRDGAVGLAAMRQAGARTVGQNESTCVVFGMPKAAQELGGVEVQLPLERIGSEIVALTTLQKPRIASCRSQNI
jgi:two-component system, chemotaxis family, protein-glutamate methylesterase/glutaminase